MFKMEHLDHNVIEGKVHALTEGTEQDPAGGAQVRGEAKRANLLKVMVDLVMLPSYSTPAFTITGVSDQLKNAFVYVIPPNQRDMVNETLEKGKFLDAGSSDTVYVWDPHAIAFSDDARLAMGFGTPSHRYRSADGHSATPRPPRRNSTPPDDPRTDELAASEGERFLQLEAESQRISQPGAGPPSGNSQRPAETSDSEFRGNYTGVIRTPEVRKGREEDCLLVSKLWYQDPGPKNVAEAVRLSRILKSFRWKVEPAYTIGALFDDLLSIEAENGEIGGDMTKQIEDAGYRLSRVVVERGRHVAWFKREPPSR